MAVQLNHVLTGKAAGGAHQQQQRLVDPLARVGVDHMAIQHPVAVPHLGTRGHKQSAGNRLGLGARKAHNRHTALTGRHRRGHRGDRVAAGLGQA